MISGYTTTICLLSEITVVIPNHHLCTLRPWEGIRPASPLLQLLRQVVAPSAKRLQEFRLNMYHGTSWVCISIIAPSKYRERTGTYTAYTHSELGTSPSIWTYQAQVGLPVYLERHMFYSSYPIIYHVWLGNSILSSLVPHFLVGNMMDAHSSSPLRPFTTSHSWLAIPSANSTCGLNI